MGDLKVWYIKHFPARAPYSDPHIGRSVGIADAPTALTGDRARYFGSKKNDGIEVVKHGMVYLEHVAHYVAGGAGCGRLAAVNMVEIIHKYG
jgi:hypothetical protein